MSNMQFLILCLLFFMIAYIPALTGTLAVTTRMFQVSPDDFERLISEEAGAKVFWRMTVLGKYVYYSSVKGNQIYTTSKNRLAFPPSCEQILMKS